jgi:ubiquinol oxidase
MNKYEYTIGKTVDMLKEQEKTLGTPPLHSNFVLKAMYLTFDILYGRELSLPKVKALEILARYPYWAWENGGYHLISRLFSTTAKISGEKVAEPLNWISIGREAQDNEQDHLFLMEQIIQ